MNPNTTGLGRLTGAGVNSRYLNPSTKISKAGGKVAQSGHGNLDWIPTLTGTLGGIGLGALGTAVAPGVGTAVGGVAGFGAGQALGQRVEDMLTGHETTGGELLRSGLGGAATGAIGGLVGKGATAVGGKLLSKSPAAQAALSKLGNSQVAQTLTKPVSSFGDDLSLGLTKFRADQLVSQAANKPGNRALQEFAGLSGVSSSRPAHQLQIEALRAAGDNPGAIRIAKSLADTDPYKQSMLDLLGVKALPVENLNTNAAGQIFAREHGLPQPLSRPTTQTGGDAMSLFNSLKGQEKGALDLGAKVAPKTGLSATLNRVAGRELATQYGTISAPVSRATNPAQTFTELADRGFTKPTEIEAIIPRITGSDGILNRAVIRAAGGSGRVNLDSLPDKASVSQIAKDAIENEIADPGVAKTASTFMNSLMKKLGGGPAGSLKPGSNPSDVLGVMKKLESKIRNLEGRSGVNYARTDPNRGDYANALRLMRDELEERLYTGASGANANLGKILTPQLREELVALAPKNQAWAKHVDNVIMKSTDVGQLRSAQHPFVNASKIIRDADLQSSTFAGRMTNPTTPGGMLGQITAPVLRPLATAVEPATQPLARGAAAVFRKASSAGKEAGEITRRLAKGVLEVPAEGVAAAGYQLGSLGARAPQEQPNNAVAGQMGLSGLGDQYAQDPTNPQFLGVDPEQFGYPPDNTMSPMGGMEEQAAPMSQLTPQLLEQLALADLQSTGGKNMAAISALASLSKITNPQEEATTKPINTNTQKELIKLNSAKTVADQIAKQFSAVGNVGRVAGQVQGISGALGLNAKAKVYEDFRKSALANIAKSIGGETGVLTDQDIKRIEGMIPKLTDTEEEAAMKLDNLYGLIGARQQSVMDVSSAAGTAPANDYTLSLADLYE